MKAPSIARNPEEIQTLGDLLTLVPGGEKGYWGCEGGPGPDKLGTREAGKCGHDLRKIGVMKITNNQEYVARCPTCNRLLMLSLAWLFSKVIYAKALKRNGMAPAVGTLPQDQGYPAGTIKYEPLPDGRQRVIATPFPPTIVARAPKPGHVLRLPDE
jgi:hypothetical protein